MPFIVGLKNACSPVEAEFEFCIYAILSQLDCSPLASDVAASWFSFAGQLRFVRAIIYAALCCIINRFNY